MIEKADKLISKYKIPGFYHFTDTRNIDSIREHGILSQRQLKEKNIDPVACGGNDLSRKLAERMRLDDYVSLCFRSTHPLEFLARQRGDIKGATYLHVAPQVLALDGLMFSEGVSNGLSSKIVPIAAALDIIDFEVLYTHTDWATPDIQSRLQLMERSELLVPKKVPLSFISFPISNF